MPELEDLIASTFYLMTRHSKAPKANLEKTIAEHLQRLSNHPECKSKKLREASKRLSITWLQEARIKGLDLDEFSNSCQIINKSNFH